MRWFGWWRRRGELYPPHKIELPEHEKPGNHSAEMVKQSKQKLNEALKTKKEVSQLIRASDDFAEALQRSMRRSHG